MLGREKNSPALDHLTAISREGLYTVAKNHVLLSPAYKKSDSHPVFIELKSATKPFSAYYPVEFYPEIKEDEVYLLKPLREDLSYAVDKPIPPVKLATLDKKTALPVARQMHFEMRKIIGGGDEQKEVLDVNDFADLVKLFFKDYVFSLNQVLILPHPNKAHTHFELRLNDTDIPATSSDSVPLFSMDAGTQVHLSLSKKIEYQGIRWSQNRKLNLDFVKRGIGGHKEELSTLVRTAFYTRAFDPAIVKAYGIKHTKGILLYGPPGTGKTLIAREISNIFFDGENSAETARKKSKVSVINGPELKNKMVGQSVENLRNIFAPAIREWKEKGEASDIHIIIVDEIDALAPPRGSRTGSTGVDDDMVAILLTLLDGVDSPGNILVIGTTNRKELIDPALLRPGRLAIHIEISRPNQPGRLEILMIHTASQCENKMLDADVDLPLLAEMTENYTGAEIKDLVDRATQYAMVGNFNPDSAVLEVKKELKTISQFSKVTQAHFLKAFADITPAFGTDKTNFQFKKEKFSPYQNHFYEIESAYQESLAALQGEDGVPGFRFLIAGASGTGKTELAKYLATQSHAKYIRVISPEDLIHLPLAQQLDKLDKEFMDAAHSELSVLILDGIEDLLRANHDLSHPDNSLRVKLESLLKKIDQAKNKCIVIATTRHSDFTHVMFPGLFHDTITLKNVVIEYKNNRDIEKLQIIANVFNIKVLGLVIANSNDVRKINLPIGKLIFEMKRFCFGKEKTHLLDLEKFYTFLNERPGTREREIRKAEVVSLRSSSALFADRADCVAPKETKGGVASVPVLAPTLT